MVVFNNQENGQSEEDRALEKIYEELEALGKERMEQIVGSILVLVETQLKSQMEQDDDAPLKGMWLDEERAEDLIWGVHSEFFGV